MSLGVLKAERPGGGKQIERSLLIASDRFDYEHENKMGCGPEKL